MTSTEKESLLQRWSRQKLAATAPEEETHLATGSDTVEREQKPEQQPQSLDLPDISELTEDSDFSGFLAPEVSDELRNRALHKLFHSAGFNITDGLDDYDEDFTNFACLGSVVTADMRHQSEQEAERATAASSDKCISDGESPEPIKPLQEENTLTGGIDEKPTASQPSGVEMAHETEAVSEAEATSDANSKEREEEN